MKLKWLKLQGLWHLTADPVAKLLTMDKVTDDLYKVSALSRTAVLTVTDFEDAKKQAQEWLWQLLQELKILLFEKIPHEPI